MIAQLLRELGPQVVAIVARRARDFAAAEDAVQEALISAASQWPSGLPENPRAWLVHVAHRRLTDQARSDIARRKREDEFEPSDSQPDDTLALLFTCCHPSLTPASAIALTLRAVGGLTTAEIARAFLVPEATMAQRISRAKQTIAASEVPFEAAGPLASVLHVLYLIFNEGYTDLRVDLSGEAIRLARAVHALRPDPEVTGLLALMLLTDARRPARTRDGALVPLDEQDRSLWHRAMIDEGLALVADALPRGAVGPYQLQAAIAAVHDEAPRAADTDWPQILALYTVLQRIADNPMVALNRAIAVAMVDGPRTGLAALAHLDADPRIAGHHRLAAVRAHLFERAGDSAAALQHYDLAARATTSIQERDYLMTQAARLRYAVRP